MEIDSVIAELTQFMRRHRAVLGEVSRRQSQLLEIGALAMSVEHYRKHDYQATAHGLLSGRLFRCKLGSRGNPATYSWFRCTRGSTSIELYLNLPVLSHYGDGGVYVVDVGVIPTGKLPAATKASGVAVENAHLLTFAEVKSFRIYPMLLAHFIGIVHELTPMFLGGRRPYGFRRDSHFTPALLTIGNITDNSKLIVDSFKARGYHMNVVPLFDLVAATMSRSTNDASPLRG